MSTPALRIASFVFAVLALAFAGAGCGDTQAPSEDEGHEHAEGEAHGHEHGGEGGHEHAGEEEGPPPVVIEASTHEGPNQGVVARLSTVDEPDFGFVELKLHDDKGDLELWLARDREMTKPFDLPMATTIVVTFVDRDDRKVTLRVRNDQQNEDEAGQSTVRKGKTNYFIFPGDTGADAAWLQGKDFHGEVRVHFANDGVAYVSDDFQLHPHGLGHGHDHEHEGK